MRITWKQLVAPVVLALAAAGCGMGEDKGESRAAQDAGASSQQVSLTGCVGVSPGGGSELALQDVRLAPLAEQPSDAPTVTSNNVIREGSWVRLAMGDREQLVRHVGQRVTIVGAVRDSGADTMGTSGVRPAPQEPERPTDQSRASADESPSSRARKEAGPIGQQTMSNGTAPEIMVQRITATGDRCR